MYEDKTFENILNDLLSGVPTDVDKTEGSLVFNALSMLAWESMEAYQELKTFHLETMADTASREALFLRGKEKGIIPLEATNAVLKGIFNIDIPIGTRFSLEMLNYEVVEKIEPLTYKLKCETKGKIGNKKLGKLSLIEFVDGFEYGELTELLTPGRDEEETEHYRKRYFDSLDSQAFGGNIADYKEKVRNIPGVGGVKVIPVWNGDIKPVEMIPTVEVIQWYQEIIDTLKEPAKEWLFKVFTAAIEKKLTTGGSILLTIINSEYEAASESLIKEIQEVIDPQSAAGEGLGLAPIGHVVSIKTVTHVEVQINVVLTYLNGYNWERLSNSVHEKIEEYLKGLRKDWEDAQILIVRIKQIETKILDIDGVLDIAETKINGNAENLVLKSHEVPILKEVIDG